MVNDFRRGELLEDPSRSAELMIADVVVGSTTSGGSREAPSAKWNFRNRPALRWPMEPYRPAVYRVSWCYDILRVRPIRRAAGLRKPVATA